MTVLRIVLMPQLSKCETLAQQILCHYVSSAWIIVMPNHEIDCNGPVLWL